MEHQSILSIVVPCHNEEETLYPFLDEVLKIKDQLAHVQLEVLFINDGSTDRTLNVMKELHDRYPQMAYYLSFSRNFGKEAGIIAGLEHVSGDYVAIMDADLQDPPSMLVEMYEGITQEGYDVVATRRVDRQGEPPIRSFFANAYYKINNFISDVHLEEGARDFRLMTRQVVEAVLALPERNRFSKGIFSWVGFDVKYLDYGNVERVAGETSWSFFSLFKYALEGIVNFSDFPLNLASWVGMITFIGAIIYGIYIIVHTLVFKTNPPGWPTLAVLVVGMGGLQLFCLGIVGKYIAKIFIEGKQRPLYLTKEAKLPHKEKENL